MNDERREALQAREDALALLETPGWDDVDEAIESELTLLRDFLERGVGREEYLLTVGEIRGLRKALEMPREAVALGDKVIKEMDE